MTHSNFVQSEDFLNPVELFEDVRIKSKDGQELKVNRSVLAAYSPWLLQDDADDPLIVIDDQFDNGALNMLKNFCLSGILPYSDVKEIGQNTLDLFQVFGIRLMYLNFSTVGKEEMSKFDDDEDADEQDIDFEVFNSEDEDEVGEEMFEFELDSNDENLDDFLEDEEEKPKKRGPKRKAKSEAKKKKAKKVKNEDEDDSDFNKLKGNSGDDSDWKADEDDSNEEGRKKKRGPYKKRTPFGEGEKPKFHCTECNLVSKSKYRHNQHMEAHKNGTIELRKCKVCDNLYPSRTSYQKHFKLEHSGKMIQCEFCPQILPILYFERHRVKHTAQVNVVNCVQCGANFVAGSISEKQHKERMGPFHNNQCTQCDEEFITWEEHSTHVQTAHMNLWKFRCGLCGDVFDKARDVRTHKANDHSAEVKRSVCPECGKSVLGPPANMQLHIEMCHRPEKLDFKCEHCPKMFPRETMLKYHVRQEHTRHECPNCGMAFDGRRKMKRHVTNTHDEKRYKCLYCERAYNQRQLFEEHMNTHTGNAPFSCEICGLKFKCNSNMYAHVRGVHQGKKRTKK